MRGIEAIRRLRVAGLLAVALLVGLAGVAVAKPAKNTTGVVYAGVTHTEGKDVYVAGDFKDSLLGRGAIVYVTRVAEGEETGSIFVEARKITIYTKRGSLRGTGEATQTFNSDGTSTISDGSFDLDKGTKGFKDRRFKGTFDGTFEDGVYTFDYEGKLK